MTFNDLLVKVQGLLEAKHPVIVAISGFGGSGKTTLAEKLKSQFPDSTLLQLDNFLINRGEGEGWQGGYDWGRFEDVLKDIQAGRSLHYQWYNWEKDETKDWIDQPLPALVIVEGVRILQPGLKKYYDLTVWIDRSLEESTEQGKARDRANKPSDKYDIEAHLCKWDDIWVPKEEEFIALFDPAKSADVLYERLKERPS
jgi:uridine kinase